MIEHKRLINGQYVEESKVIARCHLLAHRGYLTKNLVKSHHCIDKKCPFFDRMNVTYWKTLAAKKQEKKKDRQKRKADLQIKNDRDAFIRETLEDSGHIHITAIREEKPRLLVIYYIYDKMVNLTPEIKFLCRTLNTSLKLQARKGSDEAIEKLIRKPRRDMRKVTDLRKAPKVGNATKKRLAALGIYCVEDLFGRTGELLYELDCELSGQEVNKRYLTAYRSAVDFAYTID